MQAPPSSVTLGEIVRSGEWALVEDVMRAKLAHYVKQITRLDPFDPHHAQKAAALSASIQTLKALARQFYREAGLEEVEGEERLTGGIVSE